MNILTIPKIMEMLDDRTINVFEIGAGNGKPIADFLKVMWSENKLNSCISLDISRKMNEIALNNLRKEFANLRTESFVVDVENDSFEDIVYEFHQENPHSMNFFVMYGGTFGNFSKHEQVIHNIEKGMNTGDLLLINNSYPNPLRCGDASYMYESPSSDHYLFASRGIGLNVDRKI